MALFCSTGWNMSANKSFSSQSLEVAETVREREDVFGDEEEHDVCRS